MFEVGCVWFQGLGNNSSDYHKLELTLRQYGVETVVAKVSRFDWLRNAAGLADPNYWRGTLRPRPVLDWYYQIFPIPSLILLLFLRILCVEF